MIYSRMFCLLLGTYQSTESHLSHRGYELPPRHLLPAMVHAVLQPNFWLPLFSRLVLLIVKPSVLPLVPLLGLLLLKLTNGLAM